MSDPEIVTPKADASRARQLGRVAAGVSLACGLIVIATVGALAMPAIRARLGWAPAASTSYAIGERVDVPAEAYAGFRHTLLLVARPDCGACRAARPFFQRLTATLRASGTHVVMIAPNRDRSADVAYAHDIGLADSDVVFTDLSRLHIPVVPALFVVDGAGAVMLEFDGATPAKSQDAVTRQITSVVTGER
jgi:hypothetical protein